MLFLGDSPASEIYMPTFRKTLSVPSSSETPGYKFQTRRNHPKESIQHSVHGESLKSRYFYTFKPLTLSLIDCHNNRDFEL